MKIIINNRSWNVDGQLMSFEQIAVYAKDRVPKPDRVQFRSKGRSIVGSMFPGDSIEPLEGMVFTVDNFT